MYILAQTVIIFPNEHNKAKLSGNSNNNIFLAISVPKAIVTKISRNSSSLILITVTLW